MGSLDNGVLDVPVVAGEREESQRIRATKQESDRGAFYRRVALQFPEGRSWICIPRNPENSVRRRPVAWMSPSLP